MDLKAKMYEMISNMKKPDKDSDYRTKHLYEEYNKLYLKTIEEETPAYKHLISKTDIYSGMDKKKKPNNLRYVYDFKDSIDKMKDRSCMVIKIHGLMGYLIFEDIVEFRRFMSSRLIKSTDQEECSKYWVYPKPTELDFYMIYQIIQSDEPQKVILGCSKTCDMEVVRKVIRDCFKCECKINPNDLYDMYEIVLYKFVDSYNQESYLKLFQFIATGSGVDAGINQEDIRFVPEITDACGIKYRAHSFYTELYDLDFKNIINGIHNKIDKLIKEPSITQIVNNNVGIINNGLITNNNIKDSYNSTTTNIEIKNYVKDIESKSAKEIYLKYVDDQKMNNKKPLSCVKFYELFRNSGYEKIRRRLNKIETSGWRKKI
jgi:hypothetical protein